MSWNPFRSRKPEQSVSIPQIVLSVTTCPGDDGYVIAECEQIPGCMSQGKTEEEAVKNVIDAIQSCIAVRLQELIAPSQSNVHIHSASCSHEKFVVKLPELEPVGASV